jgi:hypothetical protein
VADLMGEDFFGSFELGTRTDQRCGLPLQAVKAKTSDVHVLWLHRSFENACSRVGGRQGSETTGTRTAISARWMSVIGAAA